MPGGTKSPKMGATSDKGYGIPTLKMLNPELYKEMEKSEFTTKDPIFMSVRNLKERYGYHEIRVARIGKKNEEMAKELERRNEELLRLQKAAQLK